MHTRDARHLRLAYFLSFLGAGVYVPYFPLYLSDLGYSGAAIGTALSLTPLVRHFAAMGWSWAADRWHARHRILVGTATAAVPFFLLCFVPDFTVMLVALLGIAFLHGPLIASLDAIAMDNLDRLGGDYGRLRLWGSVSFILAAVGAGPIVAAFSTRAVPWMLITTAIAMVPALLPLPRAQHTHGSAFVPPWKLLSPSLSLFLGTVFLLQASCGAWTGFFAMHTTALGLPASLPGFAYGAAVTAEVALFFWGRPVLARIEPTTLVLGVAIVTVLRWVASTIVTSAAGTVAVQMGHVATFSVLHLAAMPILARLVPRQYATTAQSLYGFMGFGLGASAGIALAGGLVDRIGTTAVFGVDAGIALLAVPLAWRLRLIAARAPATRARPGAADTEAS